MNKTVAVIVPCYNECATIKKVVEDVKKALPIADVYVYDNNSTDGSPQIIGSLPEVNLRYERKQGKGNVLRTAFRDVDADCYVIIDGDDTYSVEQLPEMVNMVLNENVGMVIGDRLSTTYFKENKKLFHNFGNVLVRFLVNRFFNSNVTDIMSGYRAFSYEFVKCLPVMSSGFEIETEMTIHALDKGFNIKQIPIDYRDRPSGSESKLNTYSDGAKVILTIFNLFKDYRPLLFFGYLSLAFIVLALFFFIPVYLEFEITSLVPRFPTLIVSGFIAMLSVLFFMCGLILDTQVRNDKKNFELQRNIIKSLRKFHLD